MSTGAQIIVRELERAGVEVCFGLPGVHNLALWAALRASSIRLDRRPPRAGRRLRRRRLRARHRPARRRADHDRPGRGEHARRGRRGVGVALADPRDRHRHPVGAAPPRRVPRHAARDRRPGGDVRAGREVRRTSALDARPWRSAAVAARCRGATTAPTPARLPGDRRPTCWPPRCPQARRPSRRAGCPSAAPDLPRRPTALDGARAAVDLGRRRRARRGATPSARSPSGSARRSSPPTAPRACCGRDHPCAGRAAAARRGRRRAVGRGRRRARHRLRPRRRPDPELRSAAAADADRDRSLEPRATNYRVDVVRRGRRARSPPPSPTRCATARARGRPRRAARAEACAGARCRPRCASSTRSARRPRRRRRRRRHVHPRLLAGRVPPPAGPAAAAGTRWAGARSASPSRPRWAPRWPARGPVVSVSGDGGFLFACGELATMAQEQIPLTAVIVDDGGYGMLRYDQDARRRETSGVDLHTPDFAAMASAFGVRAETVDGLDDAFGAALARHVADRRAVGARGRRPAARAAAEHVAALVPQAARLRRRLAAAAVARRERFGALEPSERDFCQGRAATLDAAAVTWRRRHRGCRVRLATLEVTRAVLDGRRAARRERAERRRRRVAWNTQGARRVPGRCCRSGRVPRRGERRRRRASAATPLEGAKAARLEPRWTASRARSPEPSRSTRQEHVERRGCAAARPRSSSATALAKPTTRPPEAAACAPRTGQHCADVNRRLSRQPARAHHLARPRCRSSSLRA